MRVDGVKTHDVVGIGFGPSNLSLATALDELGSESDGKAIDAVFFEKQAALGWHRGMLLPGSKMQISFLKDLVTFRNPASPYSFVAYLHSEGRLAAFVNRKDFFPAAGVPRLPRMGRGAVHQVRDLRFRGHVGAAAARRRRRGGRASPGDPADRRAGRHRAP